MSEKSIVESRISPFIQVAAVLVLLLVITGISSLMPAPKYSSTAHIMPWVVLCGMILFFALGNSILGFSAIEPTKYWFQSILSFAILLVVGGLIAWGISGVSIFEAGSVSWLYIVLTFGYLVFLSIVNLIRFFVKIAQRHDNRLKGED